MPIYRIPSIPRFEIELFSATVLVTAWVLTTVQNMRQPRLPMQASFLLLPDRRHHQQLLQIVAMMLVRIPSETAMVISYNGHTHNQLRTMAIWHTVVVDT